MLFEFTGSREAMHPIGCHYALALSFPSSMNWHEMMSSLQQASDLDLLRLRTAIDHLLMQPQRIPAVRRELQLDHEVDFWNLRENRLRRARIAQFKSDQLMIQTESPAQYGWLTCAALRIDVSKAPPPQPRARPRRSDFARGDTVSFEGRDLIQRVGTVVRLNPKTATVSCDGQQWRVPFGLLRRVVHI
ncbi:MAG: hypothetical protein IT514_09240 [Burkholderiales bacterium]|nr:hypothetical protein [Burkholderiales bacterium]